MRINKRTNIISTLEGIPSDTPNPESIYIAQDLEEKITDLIGKHPAEYIRLKLEDFSDEKIAAIMGIKVTSVRPTISRHRKTLREKLNL